MTRKLMLAALAAAALSPTAFAQGTTGTQGTTGSQGTTRTQGTTGSGAAGAQGTTRAGGTAEAGSPRAVSDQLFAPAAAVGGLTEVGISQLGVQKATDPELKRFSQQMVDEHTKVNQQLMTLASSKNINLPTALDARAAFCAQSLAGLSGQEFDKCYAKAQLQVHMESLATFEAEAQRGLDPDMKAFAAQTVPHIKAHLKTIKPIAMRYMEEEKDAKAGADHSEK